MEQTAASVALVAAARGGEPWGAVDELEDFAAGKVRNRNGTGGEHDIPK